MANILLVHWNEPEAKERARSLKALGYKAKILFDPDKHSLAESREHPPELFLIDLSRLPSQGREIAGHFRRAKATRNVPILFVGADAERVKSARKLIPDAVFARWEEIRPAMKRAIKNAPRNPAIDDPKDANVAVLFALSLAELARDFRLLANALPDKSALWIAWPKKASGVKTDLDGNNVREFGLDAGWVDYKVCAIDETWSGLCFARRK
jgi:CheY-like chemotaxis protein